MRTTSEPASHRCVLGMRRWRRGSIVATLTRPASLHYSVVVQERVPASIETGALNLSATPPGWCVFVVGLLTASMAIASVGSDG
jgi:hypothetical protein